MKNTMETSTQKPTIEIVISTAAQSIIDMLKTSIKNSPTGVSFIFIKGYSNQYGEISNQWINIGKNILKNAQTKDVEFLKNLDVTKLNDFKSDKVTLELARTALIESFTKPNQNRSDGQINTYTIITDGLKVHNVSGEIVIYGLRTKKQILVKGEYPIVNSKPLTIAKNELKKLLKSSKYVQPKVSQMIGMSANKKIIEFNG